MKRILKIAAEALLVAVSFLSASALVLGWTPILQSQEAAQVVKLSAMDLFEEYDTAEGVKGILEVNRKYENKTLVVTGRVASMDSRGRRMLLGSHLEWRIVKAGMAHTAKDYPVGELDWFPENREATLVCRSDGYLWGYPCLKDCVELFQ